MFDFSQAETSNTKSITKPTIWLAKVSMNN